MEKGHYEILLVRFSYSITGFGRLYNIIPKFNVWNLGTFRKLGVPYFGVLTIRIVLSRALK